MISQQSDDAKTTAEALLDIVKQLTSEIHRQRHDLEGVLLDSTLDHDLGLDSLARVELFSRIENRLGIALPERILTEAETPRDLLRAALGAEATTGLQNVQETSLLALELVLETPATASTLLEALRWHVETHPDRPHVQFYQDRTDGPIMTYAQLWSGAQQTAIGLQHLDLQPGDAVVIMLQAGHAYFYSFFGVQMAGGIPVPVYPAPRATLLRDHLQRHLGILNNCRAVVLITQEEAKPLAQMLKSGVETLRQVVTSEELSGVQGQLMHPRIGPQDTAFLQYTSGSTGNPKGVVLSHANLLANIRAMGSHMEVTAQDVFVSWLPLYHDMGLIGAWFGSLYYAALLVVMSPLAFIARPQRWLWAMHRHHGTLSASPNFGYELCLQRLADQHLTGLDLGSWRGALNGAEPVSPETAREFCRRFRAYGFQPEAMMPVYGLAENSVGLCFPPLQRGLLIDRIQRDTFTRKGRALSATAEDRTALEFASCGTPLKGHQVRIVDPANLELPERHEGRLQFLGPSATSGYFRNPEATKQLFHEAWLESGDLAYVANGEIYLTGRIKDIIIRAGRNIYPHELEEAVGRLDGIRSGRVTAFGFAEAKSGTERLVVLAETKVREEATLARLRTAINRVVTDLVGTPPDDVVLAPPHTVLITSSGKIRRAACRERYEQGRIGQAPQAAWWHIARLTLTGLTPGWRRIRRLVGDALFGCYARSLVYLFGPIVWLLVMLLPDLIGRWTLMRTVVRLLARMTGTSVTVQGLENLPGSETPCIFVANHASYLDGYLLVGFLPRCFSFVAKGELLKSAPVRMFLQRIKTDFVERFDAQQGVKDFQRLAEQTRNGRTYLFFPEGTFTRSPGLLRFHLGAFIAAAEARVSVVPIAIRGTRSLLRGDDWLPHRGAAHLHIGKPIVPATLGSSPAGTWKTAIDLHDEARSEILRLSGEPDLVLERPPF